MPNGAYRIGREQLPVGSRLQKVPFRFSAPGWKEEVLQLSWSDLSQPLPAVELQPDSLSAFLYQRPLLSMAAALSGGLGLFGLLRSWRRARHLEQQEDQLQGRVAGAHLHDPMLGRELGGYRLTRLLGGGGMANVYLGLPCPALEESQGVAIKVIRPEKLDADFEARFQREIEVCSRLRHPHIVALLKHGQQDGLRYLVMQVVVGETLDRKMTVSGLKSAQIARWLPQLVSALDYAHGLGVIHRDLKPSNILIDENDQLFLMDFGLARSHDLATLTATGMALGTPAYVPPEFLGQQKVVLTPGSDQYSLGVMLYEWFSGERPFVSNSPMQLAFMRLTDAPRPLREICPQLPERLEEVLLRMLSVDPEERFPSVLEAAQQVYAAAGIQVNS